MSIADLIINGDLNSGRRKKEDEFQSSSMADLIIGGAFNEPSQPSQPNIRSVENTVDTLNEVSNNIKNATKTAFSEKKKQPQKTSEDAWNEYIGAKDNLKLYEKENGKKGEEYQRLQKEKQQAHDEYYKINKQEKDKESKEIFADGYNFGDVTKYLGNLAERKLYDPVNYIVEKGGLTKDEAKFLGESAASSIVGKLTGYANAPMQYGQEGAKQAKEKSAVQNLIESGIKNIDNTGLSSIPEFVQESAQIWQDPEKSTGAKSLNVLMNLLGNNPISRKLKAAGQFQGIFGDAESDIKEQRRILEKPSNELRNQVIKDAQNQSEAIQTLGNTNQAIFNMLPDMALAAMGKNPGISEVISNISMAVGTKGQATKEAEERGADIGTANDIGYTKALTEVGTEHISGISNKFYGKGIGDSLGKKVINKFVPKNKFFNYVSKKLAGQGGEIFEELISDIVGTAIDRSTVDPNAKYTLEDAKETVKTTFLTTLFMDQAYNTVNYVKTGKTSYQLNVEEMKEILQQAKVKDFIKKATNELITENMTPSQQQQVEEQVEAVVLGDIQDNIDNIIETNYIQQPQNTPQTQLQAPIQGVQEQINQLVQPIQTPQITPLNQVSQEFQETRQNDINNQEQAMNLEQTPEFTQKQGNYVYEKSDNSKIDTFRKDAATYLKAGEQTTNFVKTLEKIIEDKDIEIRFDPNLGNNINGIYKDGVITLNPNSNRAGEFVAIHELTHAIGTKSMIDMIQKYRQSNAEFNNAVEKLLSTYNTTEINEEALGDIAGQLFGNQEYINNLSMENPSLFKRIYNEIKYLWHQFRGYKNQDQFIEDLRNKWESAYRNSQINQKNNYSIENIASFDLQEYNNINQKQLGSQEYANLSTIIGNDTNIKPGLNIIENIYDYETGKYKNYEIYYKSKGQFKIVDSKDSGDYTNEKYSREVSERNETTKSREFNNKMGIDISKDTTKNTTNDELSNINKREKSTKGQSDSNDRLNSKELDNSSFSLDKNAKRYEDLEKTRYIEYFTKDNGDVRINLMDSNNNLVNQLDLYNQREAIKELGEELGKQIYQTSNEDNQKYTIGNDINNLGKENDYFMSHRPTETGITADDLTKKGYEVGLPNDIYEHPEYYSINEKTAKETMNQLNKVRNNPDADITIYRATTGDSINKGDWITLSKSYAEQHNESQFNGKGNIVEKVVKAKDIQHAGDVLEEWGYFPKNDTKYSKDNQTWREYLEKEFPSQGTRTDLGEVTGRKKPTKSKNPVEDSAKAMSLEKEVKKAPKIEKENVKYSIEEKIEKEVRNQYKSLSEDKIQKIIDLKIKQEQKNQLFSNFNNKTRAKQREMINAYETNAEIRKIVQGDSLQKVEGGLTDKELTKAIEKENSNYIGKNVMADGKKATIIGNPYGRVKVEFEDGSTKTFDKDDITTINKPKQDEVVKMSAKDITQTLNDTKQGIPDGKQMRSWVDTSNAATYMEDSIKQANIDAITYEVQSNKKTYEQAVANTKGMSYEQKVFSAQNKLNTNKKVTPTDLVEAQLALREAATKGDTQTYLALQQDIAIMGTELGQLVQSLSMIQKLSPDGQLMMLQKIVNRQQKLGNKNWDGVEFDEKLVQKVLDSYDDASHTTFNKEKMDQAVDELKQNLADQMKVGVSEKINEWRYLSMLGNPKTHIRNIVANVAMTATKRVKETLNAGLQDLIIRDPSKKTATLKRATKEVKDLAKLAYEETFEVNKGNKYNEKNEIEDKRQIFNTKVLEGLRKLNAKALDLEDQAFKKLEFQRAFSNFLAAQKIKTAEDINTHPEIIQQAKAFALEESKIATFQQDNEFANWINKLDQKGPIAKVVRGAVIPFTRTPLNIAKTGLEYAPGTGLLTTIADVKKAPSNMKGNVAINGISKQITGTSLALLGYALAKQGILQSGEDDDKEGKFKKDQGLSMGFSIKIGDKYYDLSWLSPSSMPLFVGASMFEELEKNEGFDGNVVMEGIANTLDPLSEMSCISSFTQVIKSFQSGSGQMISSMAQKTGQNYLSQFVPTVSSQFARLFDDKKRSTNADRTSSFKFGQETLNQLMYKVPGLRNLLPEQTDYFGETKTEEENPIIRGLEAFLSPANSKKDISSDETKELLRVYEATGDTDIIPSSLYKYMKYGGETLNMSNDEWNAYKGDFGVTFKNNMAELMESNDYINASEEEKAQMISGIMKYSKDKAKDLYLTNQGIDYSSTSDKVDDVTGYNYSIADYYIMKTQTPDLFKGNADSVKKTLNTISDLNISANDYYEIKSTISDFKADKNSKGKTISGSKKNKVVNYVNSLDYLTDEQKYGILSSMYKKW